ncbi:hypothetical protein BJ973_000158 [Actinoplanes tereljensis]|uniref:Uncharacterized protein n=1 Tax=Paractinoplanes tereljensis TaxID=571912 RepID=A0A919TXV1_9ACTN|nr:hypothetical protein [Actinoplanes tereljensis]GIF26751.1 hypothetical protein Ate02nite_94810 [Actinoplanes tereljensis]
MSPPNISPGRTGAAVVLLGAALSLVGTTWDIQWHVDVGPDTFFTLPHLLLYSGSAVSGIASLVIVIAATAATRAGRTVGPEAGGRPVRVFGTFSAPLGFLVSGVGSASFLIFGLVDLWWHSIYGFDAVLDSPPHIALFTSISITMVGAVVICGSARATRWGRTGLLISLPILMLYSPITTNAFNALRLPFDAASAGMVLFVVMLLVLGRATLARTGAATAFAAVLGAMQLALWWFAPWAARTYADAVGLPLRDDVGGRPPQVPASIPMFLLAGAVLIDLAVWLGARNHWSARWVPQVAGAVSGLLIAATFMLQELLISTRPAPVAGQFVVETLIGGAFGAFAGFLGWRFAGVLRGEQPPAAAPVLRIQEAY